MHLLGDEVVTIKEIREKANMTVEDLAWFFKIPRETIIAWEMGEKDCPKCTTELMELRLKQFGFFSNDGKRTIYQALAKAIDEFGNTPQTRSLEQQNDNGN